MADKKQNYDLKMTPTLLKYKAGFGPLAPRVKKKETLLLKPPSLRKKAKDEWIKRMKARRVKGDIKARDALKKFELQRRVKFAKENPLMPRTKTKRLKVGVRTGASGLSKLSKELNK